MAAFYAARARGGVGLIVTGGIAPNERGRPCAGGAKLTTEDEAEQHRTVTDAVHARGRPDRDADPALRALRLPPRPGRAERAPGADQPVHPARTHRRRGRADHRRLRPGRRARAARRLRRRRDHGLRGLSDQRVHRRRAPTTAPTAGAARYENRMRFPVEIVRRVREARRRRLHPHLPAVHARPGPGRLHAGRGRSRSPRRSRRPARPSSTPASAGTRPASRPSPPRCRAARSPG